jgi:hypothetical protein
VYLGLPAAFGGVAWAARRLQHRAQALGAPGTETAYWAGFGARAAWGLLLATEVFCLSFHLDLLLCHPVEARLTERSESASVGETRQTQHVTASEAMQRQGDLLANCRPGQTGQVCDVPVSETTVTVRAKLVWDEAGQHQSQDVSLYGDHQRLQDGETVWARVGVGNPTIGTEPRPPGCIVLIGLGALAVLAAWLKRLSAVT